MKRNKFRNAILNLAIVTLFLVVIVTGIYIFKYFVYSYNREKELNRVQELQEEMQEEVARSIDSKTNKDMQNDKEVQTDSSAKSQKKEMLLEYKKSKEKYPDMYGRIKIAGLTVKNVDFDFIVMHTPDEKDFYQDKNWEKEIVNPGTSIWIDWRTKDETENIIIYGHNLKDQTMFGGLRFYKEKEFYEKHKFIQFDTLYERRMYQIIAISSSIVYYDEEPADEEYLFYEHVELDTKEEFDDYIKNIKENAYYETGETAYYGDEIITLCTCDYNIPNERLLVVAKKI